MKKPRLLEYLQARQRCGFGWLHDYQQEIIDEFTEHNDESDAYAYLSVWYQGMLSELLDELPAKEVERICDRIMERAYMETR